MLVYAGIDESGYGPLIGPLVIARSIFILERQDPTLQTPSLWHLLSSTVCRKNSDRKGRLAINDSKKLYTEARSLESLERGVLSFLSSCGIDPINIDELLGKLAYDAHSCRIGNDWYRAPDGEPSLPLFHSISQIAAFRRRLDKAMLVNSIRLADINAAVVFEDRFNQMVRNSGSKADCAWTFVSGHIKDIWSRHGDHHPLVVVDRQGGRKSYRHLLEPIFLPAEVSTLHENPVQSLYRIADGIREMHVLVQVDSEQRHFPVALASMAAKYLRELLMTRFRSFWLARAPEVKPTAGYFQDGRRFLRDIGPVLDRLDIDPENFVRCR